MPVLVLSIVRCSLRQVCQTFSLTTIFTIAGLVCAVGVAQTPGNSESNSPAELDDQKSILVQKNEEAAANPIVNEQPGANGAALANKTEASRDVEEKGSSFLPSTFTAQLSPLHEENPVELPDAPEPPQQLLNSPDLDEKTDTSTLRDEPSPQTHTQDQQRSTQSPGDGTEAVGTFASAPQQPFQGQPSQQLAPNVAQFSQSNSGLQSPNSPPAPSSQFTPPPSSKVRPWSESPSGTAGQLNPALGGNTGTFNAPNPKSASRIGDAQTEAAPQPFVPNQRPFGSSVSANQQQKGGTRRGATPNFNRNAGVQQVAFNQQATQSKENLARAKVLMERYSLDQVQGRLPGVPKKLVEMFRQPLATSQKRAMVDLYWQLYQDWAALVNARQMSQWLEGVTAASSAAENAILKAEKMIAQNQVLAAEIELGKSQSRMLKFLPNRTKEELPLASDLPLIQNYDTYYDQYRSNNMIPPHLVGIDQMLPRTLELIGVRAVAVELSRAGANQARSGLATRQASLATVLESARIWQTAELDLIDTVVAYNQAIGDFSLTVSRKNQTPEQFASMLIGGSASSDSSSTVLDRNPLNVALGNGPRTANSDPASRSILVKGQPLDRTNVAPATPVTTLPSPPAKNRPTLPMSNSQFGKPPQGNSPFASGAQANPGKEFQGAQPTVPPTLQPSVPLNTYPAPPSGSGIATNNEFR